MKLGALDLIFKKIVIFLALILFVSSFLLYISAVAGYTNYKKIFDFIAISYIPFFYPEQKTVKTFASEEEFKAYIQSGTEQENATFGGAVGREMLMDSTMPMISPRIGWEAASNISDLGTKSETVPGRVSQTNVQVAGVDEPDILKTDGKEIYYSPERDWILRSSPDIITNGRGISFEDDSRIMPSPIVPPYPTPIPVSEETKIIKAFPPADLAQEGKVDERGNLLLNNDMLMVFSDRQIFGYNVSDPKSPQKKWNIKLEENNSLVASRLYKNKLYLITGTAINEPHPCPLRPISTGGSFVEIKCQDIYHPVVPIPVDNTFTAMIINPATGKVEKIVSFVGSSGASVIYVSENAIYVTYSYNESMIKFFAGFLKENQKAFPSWLVEKIEKLDSYDISETAKLSEFMVIMEKYRNSLESDERLKMENEMQNLMSEYYENHKRDLEKTGIIKVDINEFGIVANGNVPGHLLNQFAMDEYEGYLRMATTIGSRWGALGGLGRTESTNDAYVLDKNLKIAGSVKDFGQTEQIYSVRFIEEKGYVVTFRQTDPFFVLDFSNPVKPELKGELKIPGFSSYLHPVDKNRILGIGRENWQIKVSLFDVSDAKNPVELDKYILSESQSEVLADHHAFLLDSKHSVFFLPGGNGGYIFSYKGNKLEMLKAVSGISAKRALYLNDYLYVVGDNKITVFNETDWEKVNELDFNQ